MTNLMLRNPLMDLQREVDRLFDSFIPNAESGRLASVWTPLTDRWESDEAYVFAFDLPGLTKEDVEITFQDGMLQISGERTLPSDNVKYHRVERPYGRFFRSVRLEGAVRSDDIEAHFEDGVLTIHVPKPEETKPRRIEIS